LQLLVFGQDLFAYANRIEAKIRRTKDICVYTTGKSVGTKFFDCADVASVPENRRQTIRPAAELLVELPVDGAPVLRTINIADAALKATSQQNKLYVSLAREGDAIYYVSYDQNVTKVIYLGLPIIVLFALVAAAISYEIERSSRTQDQKS